VATNFPASLDSLTNPTSSDSLNSPSHSAQHANSNDAIEALQAKVGADSSAVTSSLDYKVAQLEAISHGKILQVVYGTTSTLASTSSTTYSDTGLSVTITPSSATNKVLVLVSQNGCYKGSATSGNSLNLKLLRDSTEIAKFSELIGLEAAVVYQYLGSASVCVLDTPATTSAVVYKTQQANYVSGAYVATQINSNALSTIVAMEVVA
jgi:hypothetical protein